MPHLSRHEDPRRAKVRDMGRSILPSTYRKGAKVDLRKLHHKGRRREAAMLVKAESLVCTCIYSDECDLCDFDDYAPWPDRQIRYAVRSRREGDKVAPIIRWADAQIPVGMYPDEAYARMRSMLPEGIIGDHAMTHLDYVLPERNPYMYGRYSSRVVFENDKGELESAWADEIQPFLGGWKRREVPWTDRVRARARSLAEWVLNEGRLGEFNKLGAVGRRPFPSDEKMGIPVRSHRALMGAHDVEDWVKTFGRGMDLPEGFASWATERGWVDPGI